MVRTYLDDLDNPLIFSPYCGTTMATFNFYSYATEDAFPLLYYTFSNLGDLKDQLYYFWLHIYVNVYSKLLYISCCKYALMHDLIQCYKTLNICY